MKSQLRQVIFLSLFGLLCCVFVFFVPWGGSSEGGMQDVNSENTSHEAILEESEIEPALPVLTGKLVFFVDKKVKNSDFISFLSGFSEKSGIEVELLTDLSDDKKADISLLVYDQLEFDGSPVHFSQDLSPYFLTGIREIVNKNGFIPYAIDPLIAYSLPETAQSKDFFQNFQDRTPQKGSASFLFGPYQKEQLYSQNLAFALMLKDFLKYNDYGAFHSRLAMLASPELRKHEFELFDQIPECEGNVMACLIKKGFLAYGFDFFSQVKKELGFKITPYPYGYDGVPVRVYGFWIDVDSDRYQLAQQLLLGYLTAQDSDIGKLTSESGLLSVFPSVYAQQCADFCSSLEHMRILKDSKALVDGLFSDFWFKKLEQKKLNPDLYLERASL